MMQALAMSLVPGLRRWAKPPRLARERRWSSFLGGAHGWRRFGGASTKRGGLWLWLWAIAAEQPRSFSRALFDGRVLARVWRKRVRERPKKKGDNFAIIWKQLRKKREEKTERSFFWKILNVLGIWRGRVVLCFATVVFGSVCLVRIDPCKAQLAYISRAMRPIEVRRDD